MVSTLDTLHLSLYDTPVATVTRPRSHRTPGRLTWRWRPEAAERWGVGSRMVSHRLPIGAGGEGPADVAATVFIDGLLPEGELRTHRAAALGVDPDDTFALLGRLGLDAAGALVASPETASVGPQPGDPVPISADEIAARLAEEGSGRLRGELTSTSLAGLVPKIGLDRADDGSWLMPGWGRLSTWIVKAAHPPSSVAADVVDTEALCLDLGRRCGVTTVEAEILDLGDSRALAVRRFDRGLSGSRRHQEDLAQALGIATGDPERKFQRGRERPSWRLAADVLRTSGGQLSPLARLVTFSYLVGNSDHHAKNTSFQRYADGRVAVAPAYDIAVHLHHPGAHLLALDIAGKRRFEEVTLDDVVTEIASWGVPEPAARSAVDDVVADLGQALAEVDRSAHPGVSGQVWELLRVRVRRS